MPEDKREFNFIEQIKEILRRLSLLERTDPGTGGTGAVDSVNGFTGTVVLDTDDIDDSGATNKYTTAGEISKLAGIEANAEVNNISDANATDLTDGGATTLHTHPAISNILQVQIFS